LTRIASWELVREMQGERNSCTINALVNALKMLEGKTRADPNTASIIIDVVDHAVEDTPRIRGDEDERITA
jgi:hypothetical protein